jgi:hypothetical protein
MRHGSGAVDERVAAIELLKALRQVDSRVGVKNSRIAFDIALLFYEAAARAPDHALSVDQIADATQYSGPTVRLVLKRLLDARTLQPGRRVGKTQMYVMSAAGFAAFQGYVDALTAFRATGAATATV